MNEYNTLIELKSSKEYVNKQYFRILFDERINKYVLEYKDFGTPLTHQHLIETLLTPKH